MPLHLSSVHEGGMGSMSLVRSSCDISPFAGGGQAGSPLVAAWTVLSEFSLAAALAGATDWEA